MTRIITNKDNSDLREKIVLLASKSDRIDIAVAFFSDSGLLKEWEQNGTKINLIVSLRPTTNYYSLKDIHSSINIETNFLGKEFHSKFIIFYKQNIATSAILGSSNFTNNGHSKNIETNIFIDDINTILELQKHYKELYEESNSLQPSDLDAYKNVYLNFLDNNKKTETELNVFINSTLKNRTKRKQKTKISKEAKQYSIYWKIVDEIKDMVKDISDREYPNIPYYFTLDHFWHYVKAEWNKKTGKTLNMNNQRVEIPKLFSEYIKWHKTNEGRSFPKWMMTQSKQVFQVYLSPKNIDELRKSQAKEIFQSLHSSNMPIQRFSADEGFINENSIEKIRMSLKYLLYSNDEMDLRIHNLTMNPKYKLKRLGTSGVQEINGWTKPATYPIRNDKANKAIGILGYKLE
jgi:HKD family nuclease